ncbi:hypothetical protein [Cohnella fermenti]|uniref:hypothetical protein n=1 Tax=Cohnella fermenti TaxID=2565925 RepID=UPI001454CFCE|nr:hypothetical protein [Cohnella fermenti]
MRRVAIIGAGSIVFCKTLILDIMATPDIFIPPNVKRAEVPIDPALAVFSRFGELAK